MTVIIKSNEVATRNIGNLFGLADTGYSLLLDFNLDEYRTKSGGVITKKTLAESIALTRSTKATYIDKSNQLVEAAANEPRIQYDKTTGKKGLLIETGFTEKLANPYTPVTQSVSLTANPNDLMVLTVKGTGSATASGGITANGGSTLTATEGKSAIFRVDTTGAVAITVNGNLEVFSLKQVYATGGVQDTAFAPRGINGVGSDTASLATSLFDEVIKGRKECTILMRFTENTKSTVNSFQSSNNIFTLVNTLSPKSGIYVYKSSGVNAVYDVAYLNALEAKVKAVNKSVNDSVRSHALAVTYDNYGADSITARNGEATEVNGAYDVRPNKLIIGSGSGWNLSGNLNGIVTTIAVYPRKMTYAEMERITAV